ncbi:MAG: ATP synthase F0 subunit B [Nitrospirae bacterium]|nr:ATP synthase F0 subunit B [Nitrospirota bacterium]
MVEFTGWFFVLLLNFLILMYVLNILLYKPILNILHEREQVKLDTLNEAKALTVKKDAAIESLKKDLSFAHDLAKKEFSKLKEEGLIKQKEIIGKAQEEANKRFSAAAKEIASEVGKVKSTLMTEINTYAEVIIDKLVYEHRK